MFESNTINSIYFNSDITSWQRSLPSLTEPYEDESLYSYLLRLDRFNSFSSGTTLDMIKKHSTGRLSLNRPGLFLIGTILDLEKLSQLTNVQIEYINRLTLNFTLSKLFRTTIIYPKLIGYSPFFKICPHCIKDNSFPLTHVFNNILICNRHNVLLHKNCVCGNKIIAFSRKTKPYHCPYCNIHYKYLSKLSIDMNSTLYKKQLFYYNAYKNLIYDNINPIHEHEDLNTGFENRLQYLTNINKTSNSKFKDILGYEISMTKNGHGLSNLSIVTIVEMLYYFDCSITEFRDLKFNYSAQKIQSVDFNNNKSISRCPNIYCKYYNNDNIGNVKHYGNKTLKTGEIITEQYCTSCGTRFIGNNIVQSYDYNPGLRMYDIEKARDRINMWQEKLENTCKDLIKKRIPITLTASFKSSGIPIGKSYFSDRLGLIAILEKYANIQREESREWLHELLPSEANSFLRRIYKKKKINSQ